MKTFADVIDSTHVLTEEIQSLWSWRKNFDARVKRQRQTEVPFLYAADPPIRKIIKREPFAKGQARACMHCDADIATRRPVHMVEYYLERKRTFVVNGFFCSWNCAKADVFARNENIGSKCMLLHMLRRVMCKRTTPLKTCIPRRAMKRYGGDRELTASETTDTIDDGDTLPDNYRVHFV